MTNHPRSRGGILLNVERLPHRTDSAARGISSKKATEIRRSNEKKRHCAFCGGTKKLAVYNNLSPNAAGGDGTSYAHPECYHGETR